MTLGIFRSTWSRKKPSSNKRPFLPEDASGGLCYTPVMSIWLRIALAFRVFGLALSGRLSELRSLATEDVSAGTNALPAPREPAVDTGSTNDETGAKGSRKQDVAVSLVEQSEHEVAARDAAHAAACQAAREDGFLLVLEALGRGRGLDFFEQDIVAFSDEEVGQAARVVHEGCRKQLREMVALVSARDEQEGATVTIHSASPMVKLTGHLKGDGPYRGTLVHKGWRVGTLRLPARVSSAEVRERVVAPAEVELPSS
jgi:Domain of unknown function (DUF2760)